MAGISQSKNIAVIFGPKISSTGVPMAVKAAKALKQIRDNNDYTGFKTLDEYINAYNDAKLFDKVLLFDTAMTNPQEELPRLYGFLNRYSANTSVIYIVTVSTNEDNIKLFNSLYTVNKYAVVRLQRGVSTQGAPAISTSDLANVSDMSPVDARAKFPKDNVHSIEVDSDIEEDVPFNASAPVPQQEEEKDTQNGYSGAFGMSDDDMHSVTGWMSEEEPENQSFVSQPSSQTEDVPDEDDMPDEDDDVPSISTELSDVADIPKGAPINQEDAPDPSRQQIDISGVSCTLIKPTSKILIMFSPTSTESASNVALKLGLHYNNIGKSSCIVDLQSDHQILEAIKDDVDVSANNGTGMWRLDTNNPYVDSNISFISGGKGSIIDARAIQLVSQVKTMWLGFDVVMLLLSIDVMRLFEENIRFDDQLPPNAPEGILIPQVVMVSQTDTASIGKGIQRLTGDGAVGNNMAYQYANNGILAWDGKGYDKTHRMPDFVYDRVQWYK